jgi:predicted CXXCH cytochrome family protein
MGSKYITGARLWLAILARGRPAGRFALVALSGIAIGCAATPEERYRTLSFFFDDVPLPESMRPPPAVEDLEVVDSTRPQMSKRPTLRWVIHDPDCDECHTSRETQVAYADAPELCWDCHDRDDFAGEFEHGPFAVGACLQCHTPHKSQHASLLRLPPGEICIQCHDATTFAELEQHTETEGENCIGCHSPHSASLRYFLKPESTAAMAPNLGTDSRFGALP